MDGEAVVVIAAWVAAGAAIFSALISTVAAVVMQRAAIRAERLLVDRQNSLSRVNQAAEAERTKLLSQSAVLEAGIHAFQFYRDELRSVLVGAARPGTMSAVLCLDRLRHSLTRIQDAHAALTSSDAVKLETRERVHNAKNEAIEFVALVEGVVDGQHRIPAFEAVTTSQIREHLLVMHDVQELLRDEARKNDQEFSESFKAKFTLDRRPPQLPK